MLWKNISQLVSAVEKKGRRMVSYKNYKEKSKQFLMYKPSKQRDTVDNYKANNNKQQARKALTLTTNN